MSMKHFQFAPEPHARWCGGWAGQPARLPDYDLPASIRGGPDATLRKRRPATGGTLSILSHGGTRVNKEPTKSPFDAGGNPCLRHTAEAPEGVRSDADHRTVRRWPSSHAAILPSRERAHRFQSTPRLRRFIVTTTSTRWPPNDHPSDSDAIGHSRASSGSSESLALTTLHWTHFIVPDDEKVTGGQCQASTGFFGL